MLNVQSLLEGMLAEEEELDAPALRAINDPATSTAEAALLMTLQAIHKRMRDDIIIRLRTSNG